MTSRIISVASLSAYLKELVENDQVLQDIWVEGEISSFTVAASGHAYFTIKDEKSAIDGVMWRATRARQSFQPRVGDKITVHGVVTIYERTTRLQIRGDVFYPAGAGLLQLQLEQLRQKLEAEGLFDPSRKRPLPPLPKTIGVVTSPTGAVWHDIQRVLQRRYPLAELVLASATMQGETSPLSVIRAMQSLQDHGVDVVIVARGGGSAEDLWGFNDEQLVRAVFASSIPVISAIGHETDTTLIDYVSDVSAATPSVAAEMVGPDVATIAQYLDETVATLASATTHSIRQRQNALNGLSLRLRFMSPVSKLDSMRTQLDLESVRLDAALRQSMDQRAQRVSSSQALLHALDPSSLLQRGYAWVTRSTTGEPARSVANVHAGAGIRIDWADGSAAGSITSTTSLDRSEIPHDQA